MLDAAYNAPCTCRALGNPYGLKHDAGCEWVPADASVPASVTPGLGTSPLATVVDAVVERAREERDTRAPAKANGSADVVNAGSEP